MVSPAVKRETEPSFTLSLLQTGHRRKQAAARRPTVPALWPRWPRTISGGKETYGETQRTLKAARENQTLYRGSLFPAWRPIAQQGWNSTENSGEFRPGHYTPSAGTPQPSPGACRTGRRKKKIVFNIQRTLNTILKMVAGARFELTTFGLWDGGDGYKYRFLWKNALVKFASHFQQKN